MKQIIPKTRLFLVGCPRSGTTLLQSLLVAHPEIVSFPESHFFRSLLELRTPWQSKLKLASSKTKPRLKQFLNESGYEEMQRHIPELAFFTYQYVQVFINILDRITQQQNKTIWLEKTPENVQYISYIEKWVKNVKFIHIIRNGADVVASLYKVTHKHPNFWSGAWSIDKCINTYITNVKHSYKSLDQSNHILVRYEKLVEEPEVVLQELCKFIGIQFDENMLQQYSQAAKNVVLEYEAWKTPVAQPIYSTNNTNFYECFNEEQRAYILQKLSETKLTGLEQSSSPNKH